LLRKTFLRYGSAELDESLTGCVLASEIRPKTVNNALACPSRAKESHDSFGPSMDRVTDLRLKDLNRYLIVVEKIEKTSLMRKQTIRNNFATRVLNDWTRETTRIMVGVCRDIGQRITTDEE
jgi:hypothetical protein